jgi:hypothetical protein
VRTFVKVLKMMTILFEYEDAVHPREGIFVPEQRCLAPPDLKALTTPETFHLDPRDVETELEGLKTVNRLDGLDRLGRYSTWAIRPEWVELELPWALGSMLRGAEAVEPPFADMTQDNEVVTRATAKAARAELGLKLSPYPLESRVELDSDRGVDFRVVPSVCHRQNEGAKLRTWCELYE